MAAKKKAAKAGAAAVAVKNSPYVQRVSRTRSCARTCSRLTSPPATPPTASATASRPTKQIFDDKKLQKDLKNAAESFRDASVALREAPKQKKGLSFGRLLLLTVVERRHRAGRLRGPAQEGARRAVRRRGGVRVHLDDLVAPVRRATPATARHLAPRAPAAAGYPRGSRPPRRPRSRARRRRRRRAFCSGDAVCARSRRAVTQLSICSISFSAHSNSSASMPRPTKTIAQPGPGSGTSASPPSRITNASDREATR